MIEVSGFFELIGQGTTLVVGIIAAWWAFERWRRRDEHFPRIELEASARFVGIHTDRMIVEVVATIENKGLVPLRYKGFTFKLRGLRATDSLVRGNDSIRGQLDFPHVLAEGSFIPRHWEYSFIYPGVKTDYNYVTEIPWMLFLCVSKPI